MLDAWHPEVTEAQQQDMRKELCYARLIGEGQLYRTDSHHTSDTWFEIEKACAVPGPETIKRVVTADGAAPNSMVHL